MIRRGLVALALVLCCCYSYCETITGKSPNAAATGNTWVMDNILPQYTGLVVNTVNYGYTAVKNTADPFQVNIQNYNTSGTGFVFRSVDDWSGRPGNTITKTVPTGGISLSLLGRGEISTTGTGHVENPYVLYGYTYDTCKLDPVTDKSCPNYRPPNMYPLESTSDIVGFAQRTELNRIRDQEELDEMFLKLTKNSTESRKRSVAEHIAVQNSLLTAEALAQAAAFTALNNIPNFSLYSKQIPGGVYQESLKYTDKVLPDNRSARRLSGAQESLHNTILESQYINRKIEVKND